MATCRAVGVDTLTTPPLTGDEEGEGPLSECSSDFKIALVTPRGWAGAGHRRWVWVGQLCMSYGVTQGKSVARSHEGSAEHRWEGLLLGAGQSEICLESFSVRGTNEMTRRQGRGCRKCPLESIAVFWDSPCAHVSRFAHFG